MIAVRKTSAAFLGALVYVFCVFPAADTPCSLPLPWKDWRNGLIIPILETVPSQSSLTFAQAVRNYGG